MQKLHRGYVWALVAAAAFAPAASSEIRNLDVFFHPSKPVWPGPVSVYVDVTTDCPVVAVLSAAYQPLEGMLKFQALDFCDGPKGDFRPIRYPYVISFPVPPRDYTVIVTTNPIDPQALSLERELRVYEPLAGTLLVPFVLLAEQAESLRLQVLADSGCEASQPHEVTTDTILVTLNDHCASTGPPGSFRDLQLELPPLPAGEYELQVLLPGPEPRLLKKRLQVYDEELCLPSSGDLCLHQQRFAAGVRWRDFRGNEGVGRALEEPSHDDTGFFWFFDPQNLELTVKALDGCGVNGHYWVFIASGSTVEYEIVVTDTVGGGSRTYRNELGKLPSLIADTTAFPCP
jgi:hypothetical protein